MVAVVIFTDKGEAYCMGRSTKEVAAIVETFKGKKEIKYIQDTERRLQFLARAVDLITGVETS